VIYDPGTVYKNIAKKNSQLSKQEFSLVVANASLISLAICLVHREKILLGKQVNPPAKNYYFKSGGEEYLRMNRGETMGLLCL
jgi:hypothetical protein